MHAITICEVFTALMPSIELPSLIELNDVGNCTTPTPYKKKKTAPLAR